MIRPVLRELSPYVDGPGRRRAAVLAVLASVTGVFEAAALLLTVRVAVGIGTADQSDLELPVLGSVSVGPLLWVAGVLGILVLALHTVNARMTARISAGVLADARRVAVQRFVAAGWPTQALQREGALQESVTTLSIRTSLLVERFTQGCTQALTLIVFVAVSLLVDPVATGVVMVLGVLLIAVLRPISRATRRSSRLYVDANSAFAENTTKLTSTSMELRVFGVQDAAASELEAASETVRVRQIRSRTLLLIGSGLYKDFAVILLVICVGGLVWVDSGQMSGMAVAVALMVRALATAQELNSSYQSVNEGSSSVIALNERVAVLAAGALPAGSERVDDLSSIRLIDVGYRYNDDVVALDDVSITIEAGEAIGVVGPSGGGKSTLVQVLLRLRPPTSGTLTVDGIDYREFDSADWAKLIALVPQEPTLFEASIADNIRYYRDIPQCAVEQAAAQANVLNEILRLPAGFDTMLGPRGSGLSGGQKQRVAIARALVGQPRLLVMDEPSSALDVYSEQLLQATLEELHGSVTTIIVAHRMKTIELCDRLLVLEEGRVAQVGSPRELLRTEGFYRRVVETL